MTPTLIYCADGNARFAQIAIEAGFKYGAQLPNTVYHPIYFADQNWKKPDREKYMVALAKHKPHMATVLDWEQEEQLPEILRWAEEAAQFVEKVAIVPKVIGGISMIPEHIASKPVVLAYSMPTKFGGSSVPLWEFGRRPVHLLGGSPHRQMELSRYLNVSSTDGNYMLKMAILGCQFWENSTTVYRRGRWWPSLREVGWTDRDAPYEAFRRSCENIMAAWADLPLFGEW